MSLLLSTFYPSSVDSKVRRGLGSVQETAFAITLSHPVQTVCTTTRSLRIGNLQSNRSFATGSAQLVTLLATDFALRSRTIPRLVPSSLGRSSSRGRAMGLSKFFSGCRLLESNRPIALYAIRAGRVRKVCPVATWGEKWCAAQTMVIKGTWKKG